MRFINPNTLNDAKNLVESTGGSSGMDIIKEACGYIAEFGKFIKEVIANPRIIIEGIQGAVSTPVLIALAVIIALKVLGVKDVEKYGYILLIIYILIMIF